ncbi:hypothetical protein KBY96_10865 [Cyanobium sp. ATX 6A2]|nr:hypothetical protein [Cyanobium sp. ATX 6A2]
MTPPVFPGAGSWLRGAAAAMVLAGFVAGLPAAAAVIGGARALPYDQAIGRTRSAATAVLARKGSQSCLRGKLTNALLVMVASCDAAAERNALCELSNRAVVQPTWSVAFMEATAQELLELISAQAVL